MFKFCGLIGTIPLFFITIVFFMHISIANGITPLKYHKHYMGHIEATVVEVSIVSIPMVDTNLLMQGKSKEESTVFVPMEKTRLKVGSILSSRPITKNTTDIITNIIKEGSFIEIFNPWQDQKAPFKAGDRIITWVQLVSPHDKFSPLEKENQWWFYNPDEKGLNSPSRTPFKHIKILSK